MNQENGLVLVLPEDKVRVEQLRDKLEEYKKRLSAYDHPDLQLQLDIGYYKVIILERLLENGWVNTRDFSFELAKKHGVSFNVEFFEKACAVIDDYCKTGGQNVHGGTGLLPQVEKRLNNKTVQFPSKTRK